MENILKKLREISIPTSHEQIERSIARFYEIEDMILQRNRAEDGKPKNAKQLAENIEIISLDDVIDLLRAVKHNPELKKKSCSLSKKNHLFNKIVLIIQKETKNPWILKLHSYPTTGKKDGALIDSFGNRCVDSESFAHFHRWELTSKFLLGGLNNQKFDVSNSGYASFLTRAYSLIPSVDCNTGEKSRKAIFQGEKYLKKQASDLYKQGDHVFYPIDDIHRVNAEAASYLGKTITLVLTGESKKNTSTFFMTQGEGVSPLDQVYYSDEEHTKAIDTLITDLQLIKLTLELAQHFDRFSYPNSLETEVLPTIAMFLLETNFQEKYDTENSIATTIKKHIIKMDPASLNALIVNAQSGLLQSRFFIPTIEDLENEEIREVLNKRIIEKQEPSDMHCSDTNRTLFP